MSNRVLVLMAGGYPDTCVQKHLIRNKKTGNYLFEDIIMAVPADTVFIILNRVHVSFWQRWLMEVINKDTGKFKDKRISTFLDTQNGKGLVANPARWITGLGVYTTRNRVEEVVVSAIDSYYSNFDFIDKFITRDHAIVVAKCDRWGRPVVTLDWRGDLKTAPYVCGTNPNHTEDWVYADMMKTTTKELLAQGPLFKGTMSDVIARMMSKGTKFRVIKVNGLYIDVGSSEGLNRATSLEVVVA